MDFPPDWTTHPGNYANTSEIVELCKQVAELGGIYHTHVGIGWATAISIRTEKPLTSARAAVCLSTLPICLSVRFTLAGTSF